MKRYLTPWLIGLCCLFMAVGGFARDMGKGSYPNTYNLSTTDQAGDNYDTSGKNPITPVFSGTTGFFATIGQSRIASNSAAPATPYVPTHGGSCFNLNPYDGFYYLANDPVLGASASAGYLLTGWHGRLCDALITAGKYTNVGFAPIAIAGSSVTDWMSGGAYSDRIRALSAMLTAKSITPTAWIWQQGTTDCIAGMSQGTYTTNLRAVIAYQRSLPGRSSDKWMIQIDTINGAGNTVCAGIVAAQTAVGGDANNKVGANADTLTAPTNSDGTHFNDTGNAGIAGITSTAIQANY